MNRKTYGMVVLFVGIIGFCSLLLYYWSYSNTKREPLDDHKNIYVPSLDEKQALEKLANEFLELAERYKRKGKYQDAIYYTQQGLSIWKSLYANKDHAAVARCFHRLGVLYNAIEEYKQALDYATKALKMQKCLVPEDDPSIAIKLYNVGVVYENLQRYRDALGCFKKCLELSFPLQESKNNHLPMYIKHLVLVLTKLGQDAEALRTKKEVQILCERFLGREHEWTMLLSGV